MDSARDAAAASGAVISPSLLAMLTEPPPGWLCPIQFKLGVGEEFEGPFAENFEHSEETEGLLSQLLERLEPDLLLQASQRLERSSKEHVKKAITEETLVEASQLLEGLESETSAIDDLLVQASQQFERSSAVCDKPVKEATKTRFSDPVTVGDVENACISGVPEKKLSTNVLVYWSVGCLG